MIEQLIPFVAVALMTYLDHRRFGGHWRRHLFINLVLVITAYFLISLTLRAIR